MAYLATHSALQGDAPQVFPAVVPELVWLQPSTTRAESNDDK